MKVSDILEAKGDRVVSVEPETKVCDVARILRREGIGAAVVKQGDGAMVGIISERDIVASLAEHDESALNLPCADLMSRDVVTCTRDDGVDDLMERMSGERIRHLPVLQDDQLVGIVSVSDVVKSALSELRSRAKILQEQVVAAVGWSTDED